MAVDSSVIDQKQFNPLGTNRFLTRDDVVSACKCLFEPLLPYFSPAKARVQIDASTSTWDRAACDLEGWARPLFGIVPMVAGGEDFAHWNAYREGLKNGTNPKHPEYWGEPKSMDQRHVEATAIGLALLVVPEHIWKPLDEQSKTHVVDWLLTSRRGQHASNNHMFFRVFVDLGLRKVGIKVDESMTEDYLDQLDNLYIGDGWYRDGNDPADSRRIDYYNAWALHYYGLLYAKYYPEDHTRGLRYRERARLFAKHFQNWFADNGSPVPYGRSLVYRHCAVAFWGALALVDEEVLPWTIMKGIYLRCLRWWSSQPISRHGEGLLSQGYSYPNQLICERYSSPGSPYWAMKAFLPLALPNSHPFWASEEATMTRREPTVGFQIPGMVFTHQPDHTVLLVSGPETGLQMRGMPEKYSKFAYSSRYGFSIESDERGFKTGAFDNMIAFSDDGIHYRVREPLQSDVTKIAGDKLYSLWHPWTDVKVETWLIPKGPWHFRLHRILSPRDLDSAEGGFAAPRTDFDGDTRAIDDASASVISKLGDFSGIVDSSTPKRTPKVASPHGNTNIMFPRTLVPQLHGRIAANVPTVFTCAVLAGPDGERMYSVWHSVPRIPNVQECETIFAQHGSEVEICKSQ